jgi:HPr kinase/phosphorylase
MNAVTIKDLLEEHGNRLGVGQIITGKSGLMGETKSVKVQRYAEKEGFWERLFSEVILIITPSSLSELSSIPIKKREDILQRIISSHIPCLAIAETASPPDFLAYFSEDNNIPLFTSIYNEFLLESRLIGLLREKISRTVLIHGVLLNVYGRGVIINGDSGIGKTTCGLNLVEKGHTWIADDVVEIEKRNGGVLYVRGHGLAKYFIEIKGVGIVRAKEFLGGSAIGNETAVNIMVEFEKASTESGIKVSNATRKSIMNVPLPYIKIPVFSHGPSMAGDVESAVRNFT